MAFPFISDKYKDKGIVCAADIFLKNNNVNLISQLPKAPKSCIICPSDFIVKHLSKTHRLKKGPKIIKPTYFLNSDILIFTGFIGFGSPMWIWVLEQLIAYGIKDFIYIGFFGKVNPKIGSNKLVIVEKAIRDEGISHHYTRSSKWAYPDKALTKRLSNDKDVLISAIWTTDAMFKQTKREIAYANKNDIAGFDMETSALFSVAKTRNCRIASIQIESDSFINNQWTSVYHTKEFEYKLKRAIELAMKALCD